MSELPTSPCRGCGKRIVWATTQDGKKIPLDTIAPVYLVITFTDQDAANQVVRADRAPSAFVSHWATCPDAYKPKGSRAWEKPKADAPPANA